MYCVCEPAEVDGYRFVQWIGESFHDCVYTPTQRFSFVLGLLSILLWIPALFPQVLQNYRTKRTDALSFGFLLQWLLGDISNVIGCLWSEQLATQTWTAVYFCCTDVVLLAQYAYYSDGAAQLGGRRDERETLVTDGSSRTSRGGGPSKHVYAVALLSIILLSQSSFTSSQPPSSFPSSLPLCDASPPLSLLQLVAGSISSWMSGLLYFSSRIPQLLHNYRRQSVSGLSLSLFVLSVVANLCYGFSVLLRLSDAEAGKFWRATAPFLIGSFGTVVLDAVILMQSALYKSKGDEGEGGQYEAIGDAAANDRAEGRRRQSRNREEVL